MDFIRLLKYGSMEDIREILKNLKFKLIESINGYNTYYARDGYREYELMEFPWDNNNYSLSYNNLVYREIRKDYINIVK